MVAHTEKRKAGDLGVYQIHIDRKSEKHANKDIDKERSHLNYDLVGHEKTTSFKKEILDFIEENKSTKRATRKDAVVLQDWVIGSSKEFFENLTAEETRKYFEVALEFFQERFGKENVRFATVHMDELTPHMHLGIVPFNNEYKLTSKTIFTRECLRNIQEELPKRFQQYGFDIERGKEKSEAQHLHPEAYKKQVAKAETEAKEQNFELVIDSLLRLAEDLPRVEESDFPKTSELIDSISDDMGEINYDKIENWQFYQFIRLIFEEIKQFFARMGQKLASKETELGIRGNSLNETQKLLETKLEAIEVKEQKLEKIIDSIQNKDILLSANQNKIDQIQANIRDGQRALMEWEGIKDGVNFPNAVFERIKAYGFSNSGEEWTVEEQEAYYNYQNSWEFKTFEETLEFKDMPWKPQTIANYIEREQVKLENFKGKVDEFGSLLVEVYKDIQENKEIKGPRL